MLNMLVGKAVGICAVWWVGGYVGGWVFGWMGGLAGGRVGARVGDSPRWASVLSGAPFPSPRPAAS